MRQCKLAQDRAASRRQPDPDFALVFGARSSRDCARDLKTVHQFDGAVMLDEESCGNFPNRGLYALGKALDGKQQLMLLRLDVILLCRGFTEMKELPDLPPELSQIAVLIGGQVAVIAHMYIVTRYNWRGILPEQIGPVVETLQRRQPPVRFETLFAFETMGRADGGSWRRRAN